MLLLLWVECLGGAGCGHGRVAKTKNASDCAFGTGRELEEERESVILLDIVDEALLMLRLEIQTTTKWMSRFSPLAG